jgi:hypothetical protein
MTKDHWVRIVIRNLNVVRFELTNRQDCCQGRIVGQTVTLMANGRTSTCTIPLKSDMKKFSFVVNTGTGSISQ